MRVFVLPLWMGVRTMSKNSRKQWRNAKTGRFMSPGQARRVKNANKVRESVPKPGCGDA